MPDERPQDTQGDPSPVGPQGRHVFSAIPLLAIRKLFRDHGLFLASGLAFTLLLYAIPLALILMSVLGYTVLESDQATEEVQSIIRQFLPRSEQAFADHVAAIAADRGLLGAVGFASLLAFSTLVFGSIRHVLNVIFKASRRRPLWRDAAHDVLVMMFCAALIVAGIGVASLVTAIGYVGDSVSGAGSAVQRALRVVETVARFVLGSSLVYGLFRFSPATTLRPRSLIIGAAVTMLFFELAKEAFGWYVAFAQAHVAMYGVLGAFALFVLWLYYAAAVFILGAETAWVYEHVTGAALGLGERSRG